MNTTAVRAALLLSAACLAAGCGSNSSKPSRTGSTSKGSTTSAITSAQLLAAARAAVHAHHQLSVRALWTNELPAHPAAIAGPALTNLRHSIAGRRREGIRIRVVSDRFRIVKLSLDPSYTRATAIVFDPQRVRPYTAAGQPLKRLIKLNEKAKLVLHRLGQSNRFVVWQVTALP